MKTFLLIRLTDRLAPLFEKMGINYKHMRMILQLKLTLDSRNVPTVLANTKNVESKNLSVMSMLMYTFMGFMISIFTWIPFFTFYKMNIVYGMIIFMLLATMISDFSTVLLDVKDKNILLPRPVEQRTIKMAKTIHILYYLSRIALALSGPSLLMCLAHYGAAFFLVMLLEMVLICGMVMFLTSLLYYAILSVFDGEKLKDIINYFQIALTISITVGYQFIGRMFNISEMHITFLPKWWNYLIPTAWFAAPLNMLVEKDISAFYITSSVLAVLVPIAAFMIYVRFIVPHFEQNLQKLNNNGEGKKNKIRGLKYKDTFARLVCADKTERAFFNFTRSMVRSERKLKLQLYPSLAFSVVMPFIFIFVTGQNRSLAQTLSSLHTSKSYFALYIGIAMSSLTVFFISRSEKYKGAWIYRTLPLKSPAVALKGAFKLFVLRFNFPIILFLVVICTLLFGLRIIPDMILVITNMLLLTLTLFKVSSKSLPFCSDFQTRQSGDNFAITFVMLVGSGILAGVHFGLTFVNYGVTINIVVSMIIAAILWKLCFSISWKDLQLD
jgi:hypothetical protein